VSFAVLAGVLLLAALSLRAAPIYVLQYAFTNAVPQGAGVPSFGSRAVAGINDDGDVCGTFMTSNALDNTTSFVSSVYLLRSNGVAYDLFPRGITPMVTGAFANNLTQRRPDGSVQIVGSVQQADGFQRGAVWSVAANGSIASFTVLTNYILPTNSLAPGEQGFGEANAINDAGMVVGDGNSYHAEKALTWQPPYTQSPGGEGWGDSAVALAVADDGTILVNGDFRKLFSSYSYGGAALVMGGTPTELPAGGIDAYNSATVNAFAMAGSTVVGQASFSTNDYYLPFVWTRGDDTLTQLPAPPGLGYGNTCEADSVNTNGDAVGYVYDTNSSTSFFTFWQAGTNGHFRIWNPYALDALLPTQPDFRTFDGSYYPSYYDIAINDHRDIAFHYYGNRQTGVYDPSQMYYEAVQVYRPVATGIVQFTNSAYGSYNEFYATKSDGVISASVELIRADGYTGPVTVHFATSDGDGVAGKDYLATNGDLAWGVGESGAKTITIPLVTNNFEYGDRTFQLDLSGVSGAEFGLRQATLHIYNSDYEMLDFVNQTPSQYGDYAVQAGTTNVIVTLRRDFFPDGTMTISNVTTYDGSAVAGVDYQAFTNTTPVTWAPGQAGSVSYSIPLLDTTNFYWPASFSIEAQGAIDGTNPVDTWAYVDILPVSQRGFFKFDNSTPLRQGNALNLESLVEQGVTVALQSSTNLVDWKTVAQAACTNGLVQFSPALQPAEPRQFYREVIN
jgi:hypothetical protein